MELGLQDWILLRRRRSDLGCRNLVHHPGNRWVCRPVLLLFTPIADQFTRRSAAELDELFERKIKAWRFKNAETATQRLVEVEKEKLGSHGV